jgi:hypothetical protein
MPEEIKKKVHADGVEFFGIDFNLPAQENPHNAPQAFSHFYKDVSKN